MSLTSQDFLAVQCAEKAIQTKKHWWIGWQTLGRSQINIKDVDMVRPTLVEVKKQNIQNLNNADKFKVELCQLICKLN